MTLPSAIRNRLLKQRRFRQIFIVAVMVCLVLGLIIVPIESSDSNTLIKNNSDGVWWAVQTLTTVGYGDVVPITPLGRALGTLLLLAGTVMFGVMIAMISSTMNRSQEEFYWNRLFERLNRMEEELAELKRRTDFLLKTPHMSAKQVGRTAEQVGLSTEQAVKKE